MAVDRGLNKVAMWTYFCGVAWRTLKRAQEQEGRP